jgi:glycosyl transferase family 2
MKICAITMVYRDYWALSQWYAHYGRHLGESNLFIVAHGSDPLVQQMCPKASVITLPRDSLKGFDRVRNAMLNSLQNALGHVYDWVIRTDTDELICLDPDLYGSFDDMLTKQDASAVIALGLNVVELDGEADLPDTDNALSKRSNAVFSGHYSKAWAVNQAVALDRHGIRVRPASVAEFKCVMPKGVFLTHLKFANRLAMKVANAERKMIATSGERGLPGKSWQSADQRAGKFLKDVAEMPLITWNDAMPRAFDKLKTPVRNQKEGLIRSQSLRFDFRTVLPDWFKTC